MGSGMTGAKRGDSILLLGAKLAFVKRKRKKEVNSFI